MASTVCLVALIATLSACRAQQCVAPVLENGVVVAEQNLQKNTFTGTFQCNRGYLLHGSRILKCRNGNWNYKFPVCSAERVCTKDSLPKLGNGRARAERGMRGSVYRFQCNKGYKLIGPKTVYCTKQGWSLESLPICVAPRCDVSGMEHIDYGEAVAELGGAVYRYQCEDGARLVGEQKVVCDGNNWNGTQPQCFVAPGVPQLSLAVDGVPSTVQSLTIGQNVTISCTARGGNPLPTISILLDSERVSSSLAVSTEHKFSYTWIATRSKTSLQAECLAENSATDLPVHSGNIKLTLDYAAANVEIVGKDDLAVEEEAHYTCQSEESNPASDVTLAVMDQDGNKIPAKQTKMKKAMGDGFLSASIYSFTIREGVRRLFMECRAVNHVGVAITDKIVSISYPPLNVAMTGPHNLLKDETQNFTCSVAKSNPAVAVSWFVYVDDTLQPLPEADTETVTEPSGYGWTAVSRAAVTATQGDSLVLVCLAQIDSLGFKREANHRVEIHRIPEQLQLSSPQVLMKDEEAIINCFAAGNPSPSTYLTVSSSAAESRTFPVKQDGDNFLFVVNEFTDEIRATCTATNSAGSVGKYVDIPVIYPAREVTITGPDYVIRKHKAVFSCDVKEASPLSFLNLTTTADQYEHLGQDEISLVVTEDTEEITVSCDAMNMAGTTAAKKHVTVFNEDDLKQPVLQADSLENVDIQYWTDYVSRKRIVHITEAVVRGELDKIVKDTTAVKKAFLMYKTIDAQVWTELEIDIADNLFTQIVKIPEFCKAYQFKILFQGSALTVPVELALDTVLGPEDLTTTPLWHVPEITDLKISYSIMSSEVEWRQPSCVSGYKYALYNLEDCPDEEEFEDCFVDFGLETVGYEKDAGVVRIPLSELESCMEYVFMARSFNSYGESSLVTQKFRTRETNTTEIDLQNFGIVGHQVDGKTHIPTLTQLSVLPDSESAIISWVQPECFPEFELQIVELDLCEDRQVGSCVRDFSPDMYDLAEAYEHSHQIDILDACTEYVVMGRTTGDIGDGEVRAETFSTHCTS